MRIFAAITLACAWLLATTAHAQSNRVEAFLESQLSTDGRVVDIEGFSGLLSSQAQMEKLSVADAKGVWLILEDAVLDWNRSALLRGRLEVNELTAERLRVLREPEQSPNVPDAQSSGFRIPELPIAINVDRLALERIELEEAVLGQAARAQIEASMQLDEDAVLLSLSLDRLDVPESQIALQVEFLRELETLRFEVDAQEPAGGIASQLLNIPDRPAVDLDISGEGPLDEFSAKVLFVTNGTERLSGDLTLAGAEGGRRFETDVQGDLRPILHEDARAFFGDATTLSASGFAADDGALDVTSVNLQTAQLRVVGRGAFDRFRTPELLDLNISIGGEGPVTLPGGAVALEQAALTFNFDAAVDSNWSIRGQATDIVTNEIRIGQLNLAGDGQIEPSAQNPLRGDVKVASETIDAQDPALAQALGSTLTLQTSFTSQWDGDLALDNLVITTPHSSATGSLQIEPTEGRVSITSDIAADLPDLSYFSEIAGIPLSGRLVASMNLDAELPGGAVSVSLDGQSSQLDIGQPRLAALLSPESQMRFSAQRDETGTRIEEFELANSEFFARISGAANNEDGALNLIAKLQDGAILDERLAGAVDVSAVLEDVQDSLGIKADLTSEFGLDLSLDGQLAGASAGLDFAGELTNVERFTPVLKDTANLTGALDLASAHPVLRSQISVGPGIEATVSGPLTGPEALLRFTVGVNDLADFVPRLSGPAEATGRLGLSKPEPDFNVVIAAENGINARVYGPFSANMPRVSVDADIENLGDFVSQLPGPATLNAELRDLTGVLNFDARFSASNGVLITAQGEPLNPDGVTNIEAEMDNLAVFSPLLSGSAKLDAQLRDLTGAQSINATMQANGLDAKLAGALGAPDDNISLEMRVTQLSQFVPNLQGGANLNARLSSIRSLPSVSAQIQTDSGASVDIGGDVDLGQQTTNLTIVGSLPLVLAAPFVPGRSISGASSFDLSLVGPIELASLAGRVQVSNGRVFDPELDVTVSDISTTLAIQSGLARLEGQALANSGRLSWNGDVALNAPFRSNIDLQLRDFIYTLDSIVSTRINADLSADGTFQDNLRVSGAVDLFDTEIRVPDTGLGGATSIPDIQHVGQSAGVTRTQRRAGIKATNASSTPSQASNISLDIRVNARGPLRVRGRGLDAAFDGQLRLLGTTSFPQPVGQFNLLRGRLDFLGRRFDLTEGDIVLSGIAVPRLAIVARTELDELTADILLQGPADKPEIVVRSSPELPQDEVLARILFDRGLDEISPFQVARLLASIRTLTGDDVGILGNARQFLGVDDFDVRTNSTTGATELSIGQRVTEDVYSEVEVDSDGGANVSLNLDLGRSTRLRGTVSNDGDTGLGFFWQRDY